jgi:hypothetical protein
MGVFSGEVLWVTSRDRYITDLLLCPLQKGRITAQRMVQVIKAAEAKHATRAC